MIRINLLPVKKKKKKPKPVPGYIVATILLTVIITIGMVYTHYSLSEEITTLKQKKNANAKRLKQLQAKIKELRNYERLVRAVEERKKVILQLKKNQALPVKILDELSRQLPSGVWLTRLNYKGKRVSIEGVAFTNSDVVTYVKNLKRSNLFTSVFLTESKEQNIKAGGLKKGITVYNFKVTMGVKG